MEFFLTESEIVKITKAKQASKQAEILAKNGIYYIEARDGSISVTRYAVEHPNILTPGTEQPNFDALKKAS